MPATKVDREPELSLQLSFRALRKLPGRLLKGGHCYPASLSEKPQMRIAA
jgi:hypothetical protein